ncbi:hypothetical protein [Phytopseudomonas dryadis]|uniref:Uncharacterized protein n=1 Tax=Phytopseudomonas dryadis TaxID=2487520 RepID=A0A4V2KBU8_9GAMM|nr:MULTISPECIES: hypothetical protein [Pseudomonas]TBU88983.1 hypothetical protein DNK44_17320 [Pseudomonas dryadis]TBV08297.1 hypothetical protein DNK34_06085 [Pseudomonas dryadis]TBV19700.1 hypothetical protein DNK41_01485 [Pseudomonas sp. FRB 230]
MTDSQTPATADEAEKVEPAHPWAQLAPEHFRLLRLAPLPIDRHTGARPLRFVQLGRVERHSKEHSLLRLSIQLPGQKVRKEQNVLELWLDHRNKEARFGPDSGLNLEPQNRGLGRFLLAQAAAWAKQHCAHYTVESGALPARDALAEDARARRDHCLKAQGFAVEYQDALQLKAHYSASRISALHSDWQAEKVQFVEQLDAAQMLQQADQNLREQDVQIRKQNEQIEQLKREDGGLRFTITCLVAFCLFQAGLLIWIATR